MKIKIWKSLKYGIGEIILIALGITIAISLNNLNEGKSENKRSLKQLQQLKSELLFDKMLLIELRDSLVVRKNMFPKVLSLSRDKVDADSIYRSLPDMGLPYMRLTNYSFEALSEKYDLTLIKDSVFHLEMAGHFTYMDLIEVNINSAIKDYDSHLVPLIRSNVDLGQKIVINKKAFYTIEFQNVCLCAQRNIDKIIGHCNYMVKGVDYMTSRIGKELNENVKVNSKVGFVNAYWTLKRILALIGLFLNIFGVIVLWRNGWTSKIVEGNYWKMGDVSEGQNDDNVKIQRRNKFGLLLISFGFLLQFVVSLIK